MSSSYFPDILYLEAFECNTTSDWLNHTCFVYLAQQGLEFIVMYTVDTSTLFISCFQEPVSIQSVKAWDCLVKLYGEALFLHELCTS